MFRRILVANRGEVAARVLRTCRRLGIETVALATDADADLSYLELADHVAHIGSSRAYLDQDAVLHAGLERRCSAVHPGWGFLSENATFAARCEAARMTFIGPRAVTMRRMGDKAQGRDTMRSLGLAPVPGTQGSLEGVEQALQEAERMGYPVLLKARSGGGGRGMRRVHAPAELEAAYQQASAEAAGAFGDGALYLEKLVERARHIEFQVLGDGHQTVVLGARECSVQRRHQKLMEETPVPGMSLDTLQRLGERVAAACTELGYRGAGTIEMLADASMDINEAAEDLRGIWFMEMNTRLQVEHTVTEQVTGVDLVEWQLRVAANERIGDAFGGQRVLLPHGHAIECRLNAEDTARDFQPTPGPLDRFDLPTGEGVRVDTHLAQGDRISPHYDSLIAKLITHGADRAQALARMDQALGALRVQGVPTTAPLLQRVLSHPSFVAGEFDASQLEREQLHQVTK